MVVVCVFPINLQLSCLMGQYQSALVEGQWFQHYVLKGFYESWHWEEVKGKVMRSSAFFLSSAGLAAESTSQQADHHVTSAISCVALSTGPLTSSLLQLEKDWGLEKILCTMDFGRWKVSRGIIPGSLTNTGFGAIAWNWILHRKDKTLFWGGIEEEWGSSSYNVLGISRQPGYILLMKRVAPSQSSRICWL